MTTYDLVFRECSWCGCFPCICQRERVEKCACGGYLIAWEPSGPGVITSVVRAHQRTDLHVAWSLATFASEGSRPRSDTAPRDVSEGTTDSSAAALGGEQNA